MSIQEKQTQAFLIAGSVLVLAVTPSTVDAINAWESKPHTRPFLVGWYVFAVIVAMSAWRYLR
jgi:hypothetical protein